MCLSRAFHSTLPLSYPGTPCPNDPKPASRASMVFFVLGVLRAGHTTACVPLGPRGNHKRWLSKEVWMKVGFVGWSMHMDIFEVPYTTRKSCKWEEKGSGPWN